MPPQVHRASGEDADSPEIVFHCRRHGKRTLVEDFKRVIDINLNGSYFMAQACGRAMREGGGSIVNIGSVLGSTTAGLPQAAYAASKAGLIGLTRDLAQQWTGRKGIRVNAIAPGIFQTEMTGHFFEELMAVQGPRIPAGRGGDSTHWPFLAPVGSRRRGRRRQRLFNLRQQRGIAEEDDWDEESYVTDEDLQRSYAERIDET